MAEIEAVSFKRIEKDEVVEVVCFNELRRDALAPFLGRHGLVLSVETHTIGLLFDDGLEITVLRGEVRRPERH